MGNWKEKGSIEKLSLLVYLTPAILVGAFLFFGWSYGNKLSDLRTFAENKTSQLGQEVSELKALERERQKEDASKNIFSENAPDAPDAAVQIPEGGSVQYDALLKEMKKWVSSLDLMTAGDLVAKNRIADSGKLSFRWGNSEIDDDLTIDEDGKVDWEALTDHPDACPDGQAVQAIGDTLTCVDLGDSSTLDWTGLQSYPTGCAADQAVQTIGDTLTCVDLPSGDSLLTDGGDATYLTSETDDLALGGTDATAPFYFDVGTGELAADSLQAGGATDNLTISSGGALQLNGQATVWEDIKIPVTSTKSGGSKDPGFVVFKNDGAGSQGVFTYNFDAGIEEELYFTLQLPHSYKLGSNLRPHVHWSPTTAGAGDVVWAIEYVWSNINSTFGNTSIIEITDAADGTSGKHQIVGLGEIDGTGKGISSMLVCRVFRKAADGADTYAADASLLEIDFHYEIDKLGTDEEF